MFRIIVPLEDSYSFDAQLDQAQIIKDFGKDFTTNETQQRIIALITENAEITTEQLARSVGITRRQIESHIRELKAQGIIEREGGRRYGRWIVK